MAKVHETKVERQEGMGNAQLKKFGIEEITANFNGAPRPTARAPIASRLAISLSRACMAQFLCTHCAGWPWVRVGVKRAL